LEAILIPMTLPYEQYHALVNTKNFLLSLMDPQKTKVPLAIRREARRLLKHFPAEYEANELIRCHTEYLHEVNMKLGTSGERDHIEYSPRHGGWIFWDETSTNPSKAYLTRRDAEIALKKYCETL